jgi:GNAT superfamily N-acetyltransferase
VTVREEVRPATAADAAVVEELHRAATAELRAERGGEVWARQTGRDKGFCEPEDGAVFVGTLDDAVVGYAVVRVETMADGALLAVVDDLYVEQEAREVAVGERLLETCVDWARGRGCFGIDALVLPGMRAAKNFFEAAGLTARAIVVHRGLS